MKPVFKCEYCDYMDTEDKVKEHEITCTENYDRRSCFTCKHKRFKGIDKFECACGKEIPEGKMFEFCPKYERQLESDNPFSSIFGDLFSSFKG